VSWVESVSRQFVPYGLLVLYYNSSAFSPEGRRNGVEGTSKEVGISSGAGSQRVRGDRSGVVTTSRDRRVAKRIGGERANE